MSSKKTTRHDLIESLGTYRVEVVSHPEELDCKDILPPELRYLFFTKPDFKEIMRDLLSRGFAIGVRTTTSTPEHILRAVNNIAIYSQKNCIITWLPVLLKDKHFPTITPEDLAHAKEHNADLNKDIETILSERSRFKRLVLVDEDNVGISEQEQHIMKECSEILYPLTTDYIVYRIVNDNAHERTEVAQNILKALLIIGPIAHVLEHVARGIGKLFAASADDLLGEVAELTALRGSGFTWKELAKRMYILVPVFALATWGALSVEPLIQTGKVALAGVVFGFSAVALSLTTAIQSIGMYRKNVKELVQENKAHMAGTSILKMALIQDFTNPARFGLLIGAACAPILGMFAALLGWMHNGWILAAVGSTESIVAGITVIFANKINEFQYKRQLEKRLS